MSKERMTLAEIVAEDAKEGARVAAAAALAKQEGRPLYLEADCPACDGEGCSACNLEGRVCADCGHALAVQNFCPACGLFMVNPEGETGRMTGPELALALGGAPLELPAAMPIVSLGTAVNAEQLALDLAGTETPATDGEWEAMREAEQQLGARVMDDTELDERAYRAHWEG